MQMIKMLNVTYPQSIKLSYCHPIVNNKFINQKLKKNSDNDNNLIEFPIHWVKIQNNKIQKEDQGMRMKIEDVINRDDLRERLDGDMDLLKELVDIFIEDSAKLIQGIDDALGQKDADKIGKIAHTIKGAVSNFSASRAYDAALALEKIGKNGTLADAPAAFEELKKQIEITILAMKLLKNEKKL